MSTNPQVEEIIEFGHFDVTSPLLDNFRSALGASSIEGMPPTFPTLFRKTEYDWLDRLNVNLKDLLHGDQEYLYHRNIRAGDRLHIKTAVTSIKERSVGGSKMRWIRVTTELFSDEALCVTGKTTFVAKEGS